MTASAFRCYAPTIDSDAPVRELPVDKTAGSARATVAWGARAELLGSSPAWGSIMSANAPPTRLIGEQNVESQVDHSPVGQAKAFHFIAVNSGTVDTLSVYLDASSASTQLFLGIYTGSGNGHPATLIGQGSSTQLQAGAWNTIHVPPINVIEGSNYWIAVLGTGGGRPAFRDRYNANCPSETMIPFP